MIDSDIRTLFEEALGDDTPAHPTPDEDVARGRRLRRRRRQFHALAGLVATASIALAFALIPGPGFSGDDAEIAADGEQPLTTEVAPTLLLDDPEWAVWNADLSGDGGRIQYKRGIESVYISWYEFDDPATTGLGNYRSQGLPEIPTTVLGHDAAIFEPDDGFYDLVWQENGVEVSVSGSFDSIEEFQDLVERVYEADEQTWLSFMDDATRTFDNAEAIAEIAANVPVTETFQSRVAGRLDFIDPADEQLLTQEVLHWAACGWVRKRLDGYENQDPSYADDHLAQVLDYADAHNAVTEEPVWDYAEAIVAGEDTVNGRPLYDLFYASKALRCGGW